MGTTKKLLNGISKHPDYFKLLVFPFDALNSLILQGFFLYYASEKVEKQTHVILLVGFAFVFAAAAITIRWITRKNTAEFDCSKINSVCEKPTSTCIEDSCKNLCKFIAINFWDLICCLCYFIGDNLELISSEDDNIDEQTRTISLFLLFIGLGGFRLIPLFNKQIKVCKNKNQEQPAPGDQKLTKKTCHHQQFSTTIYTAMSLVPEIDGWYTALAKVSDNDSECSRVPISLLWTFYVLILIVLVLYLIVLFCNGKQAITKVLNTSTDHDCLVITAMVILSIIVIGAFLIGDNIQPFDCSVKSYMYNEEKEHRLNRITRLILLTISLVVYVIPYLCIIIYIDKPQPEDSVPDVQSKKHPDKPQPEDSDPDVQSKKHPEATQKELKSFTCDSN